MAGQGVYSLDEVTLPDGSVVATSLETHMPNLRMIAVPVLLGPTRLLNWCVPVDDRSHYTFSLVRVKADGVDMTKSPMHDWDRSDPETVRRQPSDNEAQNSSGPIAWHSEEHLASSDRGVVMMRRQYQRELNALADDKPLMNIRMPGENPFIPVKAGAFRIKAAPAGAVAAADTTAPPVDAAGTWAFTMNTPMGVQILSIQLVQNCTELSGALTGPDGEKTAFSGGKIAGNRLRWEAKITKPMVMAILFDVALNGDELIGTLKPGPFSAAPVTGIRA